MFAPHIVGGAMYSTSSKQKDKGKQNLIETETQPDVKHDESLHETEHEFELVDLGDDDDNQIINMTIKGKDAKIIDLQTNLDRAKYVINFIEQENKQLKTKQVIDEVKYFIAQREAQKAKFMLDEHLKGMAYLMMKRNKHQ